MLLSLSLVQWFAFGLGSVVVIFFAVMGIYALCTVVKLVWHSIRGQKVEINKEWPDYILAAIEPIKEKNKDKEYTKAIKILIKSNERLIARNQKLISEYFSIIKKKGTVDVGEKNED